jgi:hypothetical protein
MAEWWVEKGRWQMADGRVVGDGLRRERAAG